MMGEESQLPIDKGWAWMIMIGTSICMFFVVGTFRSQGILFVEFIHIFGSSYAMSSWMVGVICCGMSLFSPVANHLAVKYTSRHVVMAGSLLCATASFVTAWAPNIYFVIWVYGLFTGIGYACLYGPSLMMIGLYFDKRRSLANGLALAGASFGCLVLPPIMTLVIQHYTVWGGLIAYSAFILNGFVAAMLLRPVAFYSRTVKAATAVDVVPGKTSVLELRQEAGHSLSLNDITVKGDLTSKLGGSEAMLHSHGRENSKALVDCNGTKTDRVQDLKSRGMNDSHSLCLQQLQHTCQKCGIKMVMISNVHVCPQCNQSLNSFTEGHEKSPGLKLRTKNLLMKIDDHYTSKETLFVTEGQNIPEEMLREELILKRTISESRSQGSVVSDGPVKYDNKPRIKSKLSHRSLNSRFCDKIQRLFVFVHVEHFKNSLFIIYVISCVLGTSSYTDHFVILPPHAEDIGLEKSQAAFLLSLAGAADLVSRVAGGWFADLNLVKRSTLMSVAAIVTGISTLICSFFPTYPSLVAMMAVLGSVSGVQIAVFPIVLIDFLGLVKFPSAFGLFMMIQGLWNTAFPPFLGWIKDITGSYNYSFLTLGLAMIFSGMVIWLEPCARKHEEVKRSRQANQGV